MSAEVAYVNAPSGSVVAGAWRVRFEDGWTYLSPDQRGLGESLLDEPEFRKVLLHDALQSRGVGEGP